MDKNRKTAYFTLMDVEAKKSYSNLALKHHIPAGRPESPAFVRELVYGVLENKMYLDHMISQFITTPISKMRANELCILRLGFYQLKFLDSIPEYAAVNECVDLAKRFSRGKEGFVNGVLRSFIRAEKKVEMPSREEDEIKYLSLRYSYEPWIIQLWLEQYDVAFVEDLLAAGNATPDFIIRVNNLKTTREDLKRRIIAKGFEATDGVLCKEALHVKGSGLLGGRLYNNGMFSVQDESSILVVNMLDPQPNELIIDVCAAPGGKALAIAEKMENTGQVMAWDIYKRKISLIDKDAQRLGINNVITRTWDATRVDSSLIHKADRVLVDAPCSGLGVVRRKPEIKFKEMAADVLELPRKQLDILTAASKYVKPSGTLVYSTCTISKHENQMVVRDFLNKNSSFQKVDELQLLPNINNTDGFFICVMKKESSIVTD